MNPKVEEDGRYEVVRVLEPGQERRLSENTRWLVLRRDRCKCVFCGKDGRLQVDHIVPWSAGGTDHIDNLRTLCEDCNQDRSNFWVPADDTRRLPNGRECVYCSPYLLGEADVISVYCIPCNKRAPGIPDDPDWHPDVDKVDDVTPEPLDPAGVERARIALLVMRQRLAAPPAPMTDEEEL
jgi:hypothetical protein